MLGTPQFAGCDVPSDRVGYPLRAAAFQASYASTRRGFVLMSIEIMTAVWASSQAKGRALLLMLALADYADEKGMSYPSVSTLAKKSRMSERSVQVMLRILVDMGELAVELGGGAHRSSHYRILAQKGAGSAPVQGLRGAEIDQKGAEIGRKRVQTSAPDPSLDPSRSVNGQNDTKIRELRDSWLFRLPGKFQRDEVTFDDMTLLAQDYLSEPWKVESAITDIKREGGIAFPASIRKRLNGAAPPVNTRPGPAVR